MCWRIQLSECQTGSCRLELNVSFPAISVTSMYIVRLEGGGGGGVKKKSDDCSFDLDRDWANRVIVVATDLVTKGRDDMYTITELR